MDEPEHLIRNSVKALIIQENLVLTTRNRDHIGDYYLLPGGGQHHGESFHEALQRECLEEIGTKVRIGDLRLVREYIGSHHEFAEYDSDVHQIEFIFLCKIDGSYTPSMGSVPDGPQTGVEWLEIKSLGDVRIYPAILISELERVVNDSSPIYLGDVN